MYNHFNNSYNGESVDYPPTNDTLFDNISDEYLDQNFTEIEVNQRTDSPESRLVYTRLEVALQILERKIYKNTKISSLYS